MLDLIYKLEALRIFCKDAHYSFVGVNFKPLHEWVDEILEPLGDWVDEIKESFLLYNGQHVPRGVEINTEAAKFVPSTMPNSNRGILDTLQAVIMDALSTVDSLAKDESMPAGTNDLLGRIGAHLQKHVGLLNLALKNEGENEGKNI